MLRTMQGLLSDGNFKVRKRERAGKGERRRERQRERRGEREKRERRGRRGERKKERDLGSRRQAVVVAAICDQ